MMTIGNRLGRWTYLVFELVWALPIILFQLAIGWPDVKARWKVIVAAVLLPTVYLSAADRHAIRSDIWTINPKRATGIRVLGLEIEEALFFLLTNTMVVLSIVLVRGPATLGRVSRILRLGKAAGGLK